MSASSMSDWAPASDVSIHAGWGRRVAAWLIDGALFWLASFAWAAAFHGSLFSIAFIALVVGYYTGLQGGRSGQTVGKRFLGIAVRDATSLGKIGYGRAFFRYLITGLFWALLVVPGLLDGLWPLWDSRHQSWHDKVVGSVVIRL